MHLIIKLFLLNILLASNATALDNICLESADVPIGIENFLVCKCDSEGACVEYVDAWKAPLVVGVIMTGSVVSDAASDIIYTGYKFYTEIKDTEGTASTDRESYAASHWSTDQVDFNNVDKAEAISTVKRSKDRIEGAISDGGNLTNSMEKTPLSIANNDMSAGIRQLNFLVNKTKKLRRLRGGIIFDFNH
ncbi:hypothetical protein BTHERMOSOX_670 [Bathymodiolus thermophilus thioautotrophic gill symbiont]|uniref:Uncharacterized protein n=1 Tax=Bathymodiolus thermophilus thioautotrophic gill symbiont TaxID=2360 RepID=A0A1J5ULH3_9GAMM|nr:hypothetical protein [Bathymodiolus thermophilus thioautotrophic gill symbiont]OIR25095.1 hypothetical protein BGC33_05505 [Bathymodiolus thermophilus thioautotrophic gill symbiont]SGZ74445.1 hypothetical protein BTHERMOSOX_670 [Bathymodiolus thermophilus thioautotrophic gill symbiont]